MAASVIINRMCAFMRNLAFEANMRRKYKIITSFHK